MSTPIWTPGMAGPLEAFVERLHRRIEGFAEEHGLERAWVEIELVDGAVVSVHSISSEPGFGFVTIRPYADDDSSAPEAGSDEAEDVPPREVIVPIGSIRRITLGRLEERHAGFGFALPAA
jgi:hypothetical protein